MSSKSNRDSFLRLENMIPALTILAAGTVLLLSLLKIVDLDMPQGITIALIALLAVDALTERLSVLKRMEQLLKKTLHTQPLRSRSEIPRIGESIERASDVLIVAISGISIIHQNYHIFLRKIQEGCRVKIALLNPDSKSLQTLYAQYGLKTAAQDICGSLDILRQLTELKGGKGDCQVRMLDVFLPFSAVAVDLGKSSGTMIVEFHSYKRTIGERPHVVLTASDPSSWYTFYQEQLEHAWSGAKPLPKGETRQDEATVQRERARDGQDDLWATLEDLTGSMSAPADWSEEHDHYLYSIPKRHGST